MNNLIPFVELKKESSSFSKGEITLGHYTKQAFVEEDFIGIESVNMDYRGKSIQAQAKLLFGQKLLETEFIRRITEYKANWSIKFGWGGPNGTYVYMRQLKLLKFTIEYDSQIRGYSLTLEFISAPFSILQNIPLLACEDARKTIKKEMDNISLARVIELLLEDVHKIVDGVLNLEKYREGQRGLQDQGGVRGPTAPSGSFVEALLNGQKKKEKGILDLTYDEVEELASLSEYIEYANIEDVPTIDNLRLVEFALNPEDAFSLYYDFLDGNMPYKNLLHDFVDRADISEDYSVFNFVLDLLDRHAYSIYIMPNVVGKNGNLTIRILPVTINTMDNSFGTYEFIGIRPQPVYDDAPPLAGEERRSHFRGPVFGSSYSIQTHLTKDLFNLTSANNIVISMNASTDSGGGTYQSALAEQEILKLNSEGDKESDNAVAKNIQNMYDLELRKSKKLDMEILGFPEIQMFDNVEIKFYGDLFSGTYKVIGMQQKIDTNSFTTSLESIQMIESDAKGDDRVTDLTKNETKSWWNRLADEAGELRLRAEDNMGRTQDDDYNPYR